LLKLKPTNEEIEAAALWSISQDISNGYRIILKDLLKRLGYEDVSKKI
jgi:hypothetical protein